MGVVIEHTGIAAPHSRRLRPSSIALAARASLVALAPEYQCRAVALPVAGAFHSALMKPAATGLRPFLEATRFAKPTIPVIANVNAEYHQDADRIGDTLCLQITKPVFWQRCIERLIDDGVDRFVEMGPGRVLTGLVRKISRKLTVINVSTADALADIATISGTI